MVQKKAQSWEDKLEEKMKEVEKRLEEIGKKVEAKGEEIGKVVEEKAKTVKKDLEYKGHHNHSLFWGLVLVVLGFLWLGNNLGWFYYDVPWLPLVMIAGGIYLILRNRDAGRSASDKKGKD